MVLANILRRPLPKLASQQQIALAELDRWLDVDTDSFSAVARKLGERFARAKATLDLAGYRRQRQEAVSLAGPPDLPDIRDAFYQADLRRIAPMDREEEFRMARRHEFLRDLILMVHYLQRDLFPQVVDRLAPRGLLAFSIATERNLERHERPPRPYLLEPSEAEALVDSLDVLFAAEGWYDDDRHEARIIARRP